MPESEQMTTPLLAVSLKMYLSADRTRSWLREVTALAPQADGVDLAVLPTFPLLESAAAILSNGPISWGAQDLAPTEDGAQTGAVSARVLVELGCRFVEIAHAERRRIFAEDETMIADKLRNAAAAGLTPILCVGETQRVPAAEAATSTAAELDHFLAAADLPVGAELVVAYEPVWAIGASSAAPQEYVRVVAKALREVTSGRFATRILYGGSAGPGTLSGLWPAVDGLFLGRFAHDAAAFAAVIREAQQLSQPA